MAEPSLYERLGGYIAIATAAGEVIDASFESPIGNENPNVRAFHEDETYRQGHKFMLTSWLTEMTGGPKCYIGRTMKETHKNLAITDEQFTAIKNAVVDILKRLQVPERESSEVLDLVEKYRVDVVTA